jgi:tetratricopeptide (TPR) repeat protein
MRHTTGIGAAMIVISTLFVITSAVGSSKDSIGSHTKAPIERGNEKRRDSLIRKVDQGGKLTGREINNLSGILLAEGKYDLGIAVLEKLLTDHRYKDEMDDLYLDLSLFYFEKSKVGKDEQEKQGLLRKSEQSLNSGFEATQEKAMAFYKRARVEAVMGCFTKAIEDLGRAATEAESKETIPFGDGVYLGKQHFIEMVNEEIGRLRKYRDSCPKR